VVRSRHRVRSCLLRLLLRLSRVRKPINPRNRPSPSHRPQLNHRHSRGLLPHQRRPPSYPSLGLRCYLRLPLRQVQLLRPALTLPRTLRCCLRRRKPQIYSPFRNLPQSPRVVEQDPTPLNPLILRYREPPLPPLFPSHNRNLLENVRVPACTVLCRLRNRYPRYR